MRQSLSNTIFSLMPLNRPTTSPRILAKLGKAGIKRSVNGITGILAFLLRAGLVTRRSLPQQKAKKALILWTRIVKVYPINPKRAGDSLPEPFTFDGLWKAWPVVPVQRVYYWREEA